MTGDTPELRDRLRGYVQAWKDAGEPGDAADYVAKEYAAAMAVPLWVLTSVFQALIAYVVQRLLEEEFGASE